MGARLAGRLARVLPDYLHTAAWAISRRFRSPGRSLVIVQGVILSEAGVLLAVRVEPRGWELPGGNLEAGEDDEFVLGDAQADVLEVVQSRALDGDRVFHVRLQNAICVAL